MLSKWCIYPGCRRAQMYGPGPGPGHTLCLDKGTSSQVLFLSAPAMGTVHPKLTWFFSGSDLDSKAQEQTQRTQHQPLDYLLLQELKRGEFSTMFHKDSDLPHCFQCRVLRALPAKKPQTNKPIAAMLLHSNKIAPALFLLEIPPPHLIFIELHLKITKSR